MLPAEGWYFIRRNECWLLTFSIVWDDGSTKRVCIPYEWLMSLDIVDFCLVIHDALIVVGVLPGDELFFNAPLFKERREYELEDVDPCGDGGDRCGH